MSLTVDIYTDTQNDGFKNMNMHRKKINFKKCVLPEIAMFTSGIWLIVGIVRSLKSSHKEALK